MLVIEITWLIPSPSQRNTALATEKTVRALVKI
jgi:hypothetical protein